MSANASDPISDILPKFTDRNPDQLRHEIETSKEAITDTIKRLDQHVHRAVDWRAQVGDHPFIALSVAAAGGMLLAGMFKRKPSPRDRIVDAVAESVEDITDKVRNRIGAQLTRTLTGSMLKAAATAIVTKKATEYLLHMSTRVAKERIDFEQH